MSYPNYGGQGGHQNNKSTPPYSDQYPKDSVKSQGSNNAAKSGETKSERYALDLEGDKEAFRTFIKEELGLSLSMIQDCPDELVVNAIPQTMYMARIGQQFNMSGFKKVYEDSPVDDKDGLTFKGVAKELIERTVFPALKAQLQTNGLTRFTVADLYLMMSAAKMSVDPLRLRFVRECIEYAIWTDPERAWATNFYQEMNLVSQK